MFTRIILFVFVSVATPHIVLGELLQSNSVHRTPAAEKPVNDLWCYKCNTMLDGNDQCIDIKGNYSQYTTKCKDDKRLCMVKRFSYTVSTENSTSMQRMWSLERNCTKHCEPGCIIIGERTKLYACTSCCDSSLCNSGTGKASSIFPSTLEALLNILPLALALVFLGLSFPCSADL